MKIATLPIENRLYHLPIPIIGLTGGIGSGKSTVAKLLIENGHTVIGADDLVKEIYQKPTSIEFVSKNFPTAFESGKINFKTLRQLAFGDDQHRKKLEGMIYPQLEEALKTSISKLSPMPEYIFYDVPLLFERGLDTKVDLKVVIYVSRDIQLERLTKRDGINRELAQKIIDQQWPIERKKNLAHYVIDNQSTPEQLITEVRKFITWLRS